MIPAEIRYTESIPRLGSGKTDFKAARTMLLKDAGS